MSGLPHARAGRICAGCTRSSRASRRRLEAIKWGTPFFVEPRFVFAFSAHKAHCNFAPTPAALEHFRKELKKHKTTKNYLQIPYNKSLPEDLIRKIAKYRLRNMGESDAFW